MGVIEPGDAATAVLPEQFGKYSLLGHLATGGMAEVWLARQAGMQGFEKIVVIKRARPELTDRDTIQRFLDEARLVATLEHPNIAQVYEIGFVNGSYFFVMEYVDGTDLRRLIEASIQKRKRIPLADALYMMIHVCAALHYAHEKHDLEGHPLHIIHRDVSPSNVLLSHDGGIKVCDFGVAKAHRRTAQDTQSGVVKGKFSYMSPEQCQSKPVDRRSDVFSIGVLLYELTTLSKLFRARTEYALLQQVAEAKIPLPSTRVTNYPRELEQIVLKALARDPRERYQSAQAMQLALEEFAREHKLAMSSTRITGLLGALVGRRSDVRARLLRARGSGAIVADDASVGSNERFAYLADGSAPSVTSMSGSGEPSLAALGSQSAVGVSSGSASVQTAPARRTPALLLAGAVIAGVAALAVSVGDRMIGGAEDRGAASSLAADVERLASTFDASARAAQVRADGIATTPMLRAAIETDAATLRDLASPEMVFTAGPGESLEVFQLTAGRPRSLLRIPRTAAALQAIDGRSTRFRSDGLAVTLLASAPISGYRAGITGGVVVSTPVDLTSIRRALNEHTAGASLIGLGSELVLVDARGGAGATQVEIPVPSMGAWTGGAARLLATRPPAAGLPWAHPVRYIAGALAVLLLLGFVVSLRRPRAMMAPAPG
jgi:serine/threonine protein kinase